MIIPVRCVTCGNVIGNQYRYYLDEVRRLKIAKGEDVEKVHYLTKKNAEKTVEGMVLDDLGIKDMCCRRHFLCHVDID
jgi:DNA-directed RNA polymerase subunit N (RpoN/RPB10)